MIIVLVLSKFDDGNDYLEILEKFNHEIVLPVTHRRALNDGSYDTLYPVLLTT